MKSGTVILLASLPAAFANCPNACSGHGTCDASSLCQCYANWMSADCSERVCTFGHAFVDSPLGDLDGDGTHEPQAAWAPNMHTRVDSKDYIVGHTSELGFSKYGYARSSRDEDWDEAHFYRECSNKGTCNRDTGVCECYPGYEGAGCARAVCPNDCSGHGVCRYLSELDETYSAWDKDATQQCICDGGYEGADCSLRMCPVGADPIENAQVVKWSVQGIYFRSMTLPVADSNDFSNVVAFLEDKPEKVFYTVTFTDEYGDEWTSSVQTVDYYTQCQSFTDNGQNFANCVSTPHVDINSDVHAYISSAADSLNNTLNALPAGVMSDHFVWAAAAELEQRDGSGSSCDLTKNGQRCGAGATIGQTTLHTFPTTTDDAYVDSLDFRLDTNILSACDWGDDSLGYDTGDNEKFGFCLYVKMPPPGIRTALRVNHWFNPKGNVDGDDYSFSEVSGESNGFTSDDDLFDPQSLVVVQDLQDKRAWNSADGDLIHAFIDQQTTDMDYCSKRGLCDFESGICNCFSGFSGLRCDSQNAVTYAY